MNFAMIRSVTTNRPHSLRKGCVYRVSFHTKTLLRPGMICHLEKKLYQVQVHILTCRLYGGTYGVSHRRSMFGVWVWENSGDGGRKLCPLTCTKADFEWMVMFAFFFFFSRYLFPQFYFSEFNYTNDECHTTPQSDSEPISIPTLIHQHLRLGLANELQDTSEFDSETHPTLRLSTGAPPGYLDPYPQVFKCQNPYLDPQRFFPTDHLDPQVKNLWVTGTCRSPVII